MSKKKKKILAKTVVVLCLCLLCMTVAAYVLSKPNIKTHNVITTGDVSIQLTEIVEYDTDFDGKYDKTEVIPAGSGAQARMMPGTKVLKRVSIQNLAAESYIRVKFDVSFHDPANGNKELTHLSADPVKIACSSATPGHWLDGGDGYYYYYKPLLKAAADELLGEITLDAMDITNEYQGCAVHVNVIAEAVQAKNQNPNGDPAFDVTRDVAGWPVQD